MAYFWDRLWVLLGFLKVPSSKTGVEGVTGSGAWEALD